MNAITTESTSLPPADAVVGEEPTAEELEQVAWAQETIRNAASTLIDSHLRLVTLNSVLLAGSAAFLAQSAMPSWAKSLGVVCLMISLGCSLWGSLPREIQICPNAPYQIRRAREDYARSRLRALTWASGLLFCGLLAFALGMLV